MFEDKQKLEAFAGAINRALALESKVGKKDEDGTTIDWQFVASAYAGILTFVLSYIEQELKED